MMTKNNNYVYEVYIYPKTNKRGRVVEAYVCVTQIQKDSGAIIQSRNDWIFPIFTSPIKKAKRWASKTIEKMKREETDKLKTVRYTEE